MTEKALEVNQIPGGLVVSQTRDVIDGDLSVNILTEDLLDQLPFGLDFGLPIFVAGEDFPISISQHVVSLPRENLQCALEKHWRKSGLHQRLTSLPIATCEWTALLFEQFTGGRQ